MKANRTRRTVIPSPEPVDEQWAAAFPEPVAWALGWDSEALSQLSNGRRAANKAKHSTRS